MLSPKKRRGLAFAALSASVLLLSGCGSQIAVLHPEGPVARQEYNLIIWSFILMAFVGLAVFILFAYMLIKYRARPGVEKYYDPNLEGNRKLEVVWTVIPLLIVIALAIPTVKTTYALTQPPVQAHDPMEIDVTSAAWKWIFQYPGQHIETVNYLVIPTGVPVKFILTSVGPMNTFWIPELGGMEFTMPGANLGLWLEASKSGVYLGRGANFSGKGFAHMQFNVYAKPQAEFNQWVAQVKAQDPPLTMAQANQLVNHHGLSPILTFSSYPAGAVPQNQNTLMSGM
ncbi:cytochrome aa3 quinol oxidase subunit II [Sulfoacidibacillus thermotolerans]|uniref:Quinol oxidase polypeptide II n=1 Tax=Sulfoacidibacillus thermotolerans TaxID=1765684 RepID=A0A2U3DC67_SULT2|nr:cytochrome aa3 quinol oxidase subunit II [Sulfoacidibacillus thermotolerans]PWI58866.1 cytochrome aa3 quinol oxidase subunit II [Sulfoacidibacillus thermotolerans]